MVLKRIIRQYLNQHFPENLRPTQKLDRKSAKIIENQNHFNNTPLIVRTTRAHRKLERSRIFPLIPSTDKMEYEYSGNLLKIQHDPFFKEIQRSSTFTHSLEKSTIHYQTKWCKDSFLNSITHNVDKNIISSNQWTGLDINRLTSRTKYYNVWKTRKCLYSLNQYKSALGNKNRRNRSSIYKLQLRERKKLALLYGNLSKKEIYRTIQIAEKYRGALRDNIFRVLESRLDVILYRVGFFKTIPTARQWIIHRKILVNQQVVTIAHYQVKAGDVVSVDPRYACLLIEMINSRFQKMPGFTLKLNQIADFFAEQTAGFSAEQAADFFAQQAAGLSEEQLADFFPQAAGLFEADTENVSDDKLVAFFAEQEQEQEEPTTQQAAGISAEQAVALFGKLAALSEHRRVGKEMDEFGILFLYTLKHILNTRLEIMGHILSFRRDKKLLHKWQKLNRDFKWKPRWGRKKRISLTSRDAKKFFRWEQKFRHFPTEKEEWLPRFETIKELLKMKIIVEMSKKEYGFKLRDPLFNYKHSLLFNRLFKKKKKKKKENEIENYFSIDVNDVKKPLHLEISYKTLTVVYLYSPQKLFFPVNIDIDAVKKSYY